MSRARRAAALAAVLLAAALPRLAALRTQPWLDEVWSIELARGAKTLGDVLFGIHHDNSNPLNALWLWLVRDARDWAAFRVLAFAAGMLTVLALARDEEDPPRGLLAGALAAASIPLVLYSTEARGYAPMALFALLAWRLLPKRGAPGARRAAAFGACVALGALSHPTFAVVLPALLLRAALALPRRDRVRGLLVLFAPPLALCALYQLLQRGPTIVGAGAMDARLPVVFRALARFAGAPDAGPWAVLGAAAVLTLCGAELARLRREKDPDFFFFAALFAADAVLLAAFPFPYERHLFACAPFALILCARTLARLLRGRPAAKAAGAVFLGLFLAGNAARDRALAAEGRGHYLEALERMARDTAGAAVTVAGDHDFRDPMMLRFYAPYVAGAKTFRYVKSEDWGRGEIPEWYLRHDFVPDPRAAPIALTFRDGSAYGLVDVYPYSGLSGWTWALYRRAP